MIVYTKYKPKYASNDLNTDDTRQVSDYIGLTQVYKKLDVEKDRVIDCLTIYPDHQNGYKTLEKVNLDQTEVNGYNNIYRLGIRLPQTKSRL